MNRIQSRRASCRGAKSMRAAFCLLACGCAGLLPVAGAEEANSVRADDPAVRPPAEVLTHVSQLRSVPPENYLRGCPLHLSGTVTLVDPTRHLLVVQDATGAVAVNLDASLAALAPGQIVEVEAPEVTPEFVSFPAYPYWPSGRAVRAAFEAPSNWGDFHLTRMRGYLRPPATGEYTFWIASDNSSELWLSPDADPAKVRRIALVAFGTWVNPREWSRYASQRSESILLRAGQSYYIEAFQEQLLEDDHLAVAWQGPGLTQAIVDGRYLAPWTEPEDRGSAAGTNGILWEYWTNYSAGTLAGLPGPRLFDSAVSAKAARVTVLGKGTFPEPRPVRINQALVAGDNYRWVETEGMVSFIGTQDGALTLDLADGDGWSEVRVAQWRGDFSHRLGDWLRVEGVGERVQSARGLPVPGIIWVPSGQNLSPVERTNAALTSLRPVPAYQLAQAGSNAALGGFYFTRGVVTFNDQVRGRDWTFVQDDTSGILLSQADPRLRDRLQVGDLVDLGGNLLPGKYSPRLIPMAVSVVGWRQLPEPEMQPLDTSLPAARDGRWTELEGVVRAVNTDGTLALMTRSGRVWIWLGKTPTNILGRYVDSTLRVRGVMSLATPESPLLLVPSRTFVEMQAEAPGDPFLVDPRSIASLNAAETERQQVHRVKIAGAVTFRHENSLFLQDASGGARAQSLDPPRLEIGDVVEVVGFPESDYSLPVLTEALVRQTGARQPPDPLRLKLADVVAGKHNGCLVRLRGTLLSQKTDEITQVLELQEAQRVFQALLPYPGSRLPALEPGSLLEISGVCQVKLAGASALGKAGADSPSAAAVQIWLRSPRDVQLLSGPPWWTWKRAATLIAVLLTILVGTLLWIHLLRRRLERQQAARLAFTRQILQSQESERRRIAVNLHDSLGQNLLVIKNQARLGLQPVADAAVLRQRLDAISGVASQAIEEVRQITHDLRPYQLDRLGLTLAIRALIKRAAENSPILFASHVDEIDGVFDQESEIHVYRIVQEGLSNIIKHSGATEAAVVIKKQAGLVSLSIRDNGRGFQAGLASPAGPPATGFGLSGISERSRILGGTLTLDSRPGQGTHLTCEITLTRS